jgi:hypothetical protein
MFQPIILDEGELSQMTRDNDVSTIKNVTGNDL